MICGEYWEKRNYWITNEYGTIVVFINRTEKWRQGVNDKKFLVLFCRHTFLFYSNIVYKTLGLISLISSICRQYLKKVLVVVWKRLQVSMNTKKNLNLKLKIYKFSKNRNKLTSLSRFGKSKVYKSLTVLILSLIQ